MSSETQTYIDLIKTTIGSVKLAPNIVPVKLEIYEQSYTAFIGGAADKYPFVYGDIKPIGVGDALGPTEIVGSYARGFDTGNVKHMKEYYGYEEAYNNRRVTKWSDPNKKNAFNDIVEVYKKNNATQINIIGHSLGGWNAAGLVTELNKEKIPVNLLITIDPVGILLSKATVPGILTTPIVRAQIYLLEPKPNAKTWVNVFSNPDSITMKDIKNIVGWEDGKPVWRGYNPSSTGYSLDDLIADAGGRWKGYPQSTSDTFYETKFSHAWFTKMMREIINDNKSAEMILKNELKQVNIK